MGWRGGKGVFRVFNIKPPQYPSSLLLFSTLIPTLTSPKSKSKAAGKQRGGLGDASQ